MANNKLTNSLRNSIAAESKSIDQRATDKTITQHPGNNAVKSPPHNNAAAAVTKPTIATTQPVKTPVKKLATKKSATVTKNKAPKTVAAKTARLPAKSASAAKSITTAAKVNTNKRKKAANPNKSINNSDKTNKVKKVELPETFALGLAHHKLHNMVETHYHLCEICLDNMQIINDNLHDYFNQLVEVHNLSALIKLNLSYLSTAPTRVQEMIAQNKSIFSDFFKFAKPEE